MTAGEAPVFGGKPVHPSLVKRLERILAGLTWLERRKVKASVTQGWAPASPWSKDTHATGHAIDFATKTWSAALIRKVISLFQQNGFEAVLRLRGEDIGTGAPIKTEHIHAVLRGYGNSQILSQVTAPGAHRHVEVELKKREMPK